MKVVNKKVIHYGARLGGKVGILALLNVGKGKTKKSIVVGCTHLKASLSEENVRLLQMKIFFDEVKAICNGYQYPIIFGGDLNARPGAAVYRLVSGVSQKASLVVKNHNYTEVVTNLVANFTSAYGKYKVIRPPVKEDVQI